MKTIKLSFPNQEGLQLASKIDLPVDGKIKAFALFAHCFTCNKNLTAIRNISLGLTRNGIAVMRFDFTGLGESEGEFADSNFSSNVADLISAANYLEKEYEAPKLMIGHSLGGAAALLAAGQIDSVQAVATIGAPAEPIHVSKLFHGAITQLEKEGQAEVNIGGRSFRVKKQFLEDLEKHPMEYVVKNLKKALLIAHSPQDTVVGVENAAQLYSQAIHPKSFLSLDGADHLLSDKADSQYVGNMIANWASRYVDFRTFETLKTESQVLTYTGEQKYRTEIVAGKHTLVGDEPKSVGGQDLGASPYDFLLSALGSCTGMTLRMYADRKKWPLKGVKVHLKHYQKIVQETSDGEIKKNKIDVIERKIELEGDFDENQRERLLQIADRCPVHRTLHGQIDIQSKLIEK